MALRDLISLFRSRRPRTADPAAVDLLAVSGSDVGRRFTVFASRVAIVGAESSRDARALCLRDPSVSPSQAVVHRVSGGFEIEHDPKARLPTRVNGVAVQRQRIAPGDRIEIGDLRLEVRERPPHLSGIFELPDPGEAAAAQGADAPGERATVLAPGRAEPDGFRLVVLHGAARETHPLAPGRTLIGRGDDCAVRFAQEPSVSRRHALVEVGDGAAELVHLSAVNTTRVNGTPVEERRRLRPGDEIELADAIVLRLEGPAPSSLETQPRAPAAAGLRSEMEAVHERRRRIEEQFAVEASFLDVDVVDSFRLKQATRDPERIVLSFERWREWIGESIRAQRGEVLNSNGDELMAFFEDAVDALGAGRAILDGLEAFNRERNLLAEPIRLRLGIHTGRSLVDRQRGVAYSAVLDMAGHLQKAAPVDGLLVSEATVAELGPRLPDGLALEAAGPVDGVGSYRLVARG